MEIEKMFSLKKCFSNFYGPWTIFQKISDGPLCHAGTSWTSL